MTLVRIVSNSSPTFVAGLVAEDGEVVRAAPIIGYMLGWDGRRVAAYCALRGWTWEVVG